MTDTETALKPIPVVARHDVHPQAYEITQQNYLDVAAHLGLNVLDSPLRIEIPFERRYNLGSYVRPGDWLIVHPTTVRDLEPLPAARFEEQYDRADRDLLDMAVLDEFPDAHAWALIASGPAGVYALPGRGIVDAAHLIGIAELVSRSGRAR